MTVNKCDSVHSFHISSTHIRLIKLQLNEIFMGKAQCKALSGHITSVCYVSHSQTTLATVETLPQNTLGNTCSDSSQLHKTLRGLS